MHAPHGSHPRRPRPARLALTALVALASGLATGHGHEGAEPKRSSDATVSALEKLVRETAEQRGVPGLSIAVRSQGRRWEAGFGMADVENEVPATPRTVYRFASISKPITAVAVLQCVEQGQLDLDAPIRTYVPQWPEMHPTITARQLLGHLGGVRWYRGPREMFSTRHYHSLRESLSQFADDPLEAPPGKRFLYSTYGYTLLGLAVEGIAGRPFVDHLKTSVFEPAGMTASRDDDTEAIIPHRAAGYWRTPSHRLRNSFLLDTSGRVPGGGLCGTAGDLAAFGEAFLDGRLVRPETVQLMTAMQKTTDGKPTFYGLGWNLSRHDDRREVWHGGNQARVTGLLYTRPDRRTVVAILCNLEGTALMDLARSVADAAEADE